jgi:histidinol dehydrogenase
MVRSSLVLLSEEDAKLLAEIASALAEAEGLDAHAKALRARKKR